jgi:hypothetical protein
MDFRAKLKIAAGKRLANRGGINAPPIGTWERVGWDEWHGERAWNRQEREERESQAHITTGQFTPIRSRTPGIGMPGAVTVAPVWRIVAALFVCSTLYIAGRYVLHRL